VLLGALAAAVGLWLWSRTATGKVIFVDAIETLLNGPRGIRNNNPGNIDWIENPSKRWRGMVRKETPEEGGRFAVFDTPANGVRAIAQELLLDERRGVRTIAGLVSAWAPSSENNTSAYVRAVSRAVGVEPDDSIDVRSYLPRLVAAIIHHENGVQPYQPDDLNAWVFS
jgi:hypothetical protein